MNVRIILYVIVSLILIVFLKPENPTFSKLLTVMVSAIVAVASINHLIPVMDFIKKLSDNSGFDNKYLEIILKCTAICFLGSFTSNLCKDNGEPFAACTYIQKSFSLYAGEGRLSRNRNAGGESTAYG